MYVYLFANKPHTMMYHTIHASTSLLVRPKTIMNRMNWSRARFEEEARLLCSCLDETSNLSFPKAFALLHWMVQQDANDGAVYLTHDAVIALPADVGHADESLEDATILEDPEQFADEDRPGMTIFWYFSVVYSDSYQVPVLYFHVQHQDGSPCSRDQVVGWLRPNATTATEKDSSDSTIDSWDFVSQERHPYTGFPSYFLHPCRTSERMELLQESTSPGETEINYLWAWMSIVLPAVNHPIPPVLYQSCLERLQNKSTAKEERIKQLESSQ